jgi:hypothetical protein
MIRLARDLMPIKPASWNERERTIDVVWTTGAAVRRYDGDREFLEVLDLAGARLGRLNGGAPFLKVHRADRLDAVLGVVVAGSARIVNGQGIATIKLSSAKADAGDVLKIASGIIRHVSVGYAIHKAVRAGEAGGVPVIRVVDWEPMEISAVPIPADAGAHIRLMQMAGNAQDMPCQGAAALALARMAQRARLAF